VGVTELEGASVMETSCLPVKDDASKLADFLTPGLMQAQNNMQCFEQIPGGVFLLSSADGGRGTH
jgi:hypothetical protein